MDRENVASSNIISIGYDEPSQTLEVEFADGAVYQYYNVGQNTFDEFMRAPSKGQFLAYQIKNAFPYSRVG
ncbi:MAG: KTSC domain-containing protein [Bdellovibrionales bacterium]|nr:KTSC domain-containing protein [Bdellovibrionales bacterium]